MSMADSPALKAQGDKETAPTITHSQKSYRRKYRKIMVRFERQMRKSTTLFRNQQRMQDISQRIAEQNDQILDLLVELNSLPQVPARMRFNLGDSTADEKHQDPQEAIEALRAARHSVQKGDSRQCDYEDMEHALLDTLEFAPHRKYIDLARGGLLSTVSDEARESTGTGGFLSTKQEEKYLHSLDEYIDNRASHARTHALGASGNRTTDKLLEREREAQLRNPVSVYNWLRKNQPQVFLQDGDNDKSKVSRTSKRASTNKLAKGQPELYDEDGIAIEPSTGRGKRKRDDDPGYRPKGGHARPMKRRKEEPGKRSKRTSMDISNS